MRAGVFAALLGFGAIGFASPASADDARDALVRCAWSQASTTSATLVERVRFDRQYIYDAEGSPTVGLIMRILAACPAERAALGHGSERREELRRFLRRLRSEKPQTVSPDVFAEPVFRCESRFLDAAESAPAAIGWGYGADLSQHQLSHSSTIEGHSAIVSSGSLDDPAALSRLLEQAERAETEALETETLAEGRASGRAFRLKDGGGARVCKFVHPDGSYTDA